MTTRDVMDLVRIPNATTAVGDVLAGAALAGMASPFETSRWPVVALTAVASAALYTGGMALNDVADASTDARERPERPIPSGRIPRGTAVGITTFLLAAGLACAWFAGGATFVVATVLTFAIVIYDLVLAGKTLVGPFGMAACRGLNVWMGLSALGGGPGGLAAAGIHAAYIFGVTHLSLGEVRGSKRSSIAVAMLLMVAAVLAVLALGRSLQPGRDLGGWLALAVAMLAVLWPSSLRLVRSWVRPEAARIGPAVGAMVSAVLWLAAGYAVAAGAVSWLYPFLALGIVQVLLRGRFPVT